MNEQTDDGGERGRIADALHPHDQGERFGTWPDEVSRYMYGASPSEWVPALAVRQNVPTVDLGGANGLLRPLFPDLLTVDNDESKGPDVHADVTRFVPTDTRYRQAVARYLLHYLDDEEARRMFATVATYAHTFVVVQFVAPPGAKDANSFNEGRRYWRSHSDILALAASAGWVPNGQWIGPEYEVTSEFYRNRLGAPPAGFDYIPHPEHLYAVTLRRSD